MQVRHGHCTDNSNQPPTAPSFHAGRHWGPCWPGECVLQGGTSNVCSKWVECLSAALLLLREARGMAAGSSLGSWDKGRVSHHCLSLVTASLPTGPVLRGGRSCWMLLEVIKVETPFPVLKTIWKNTAKHIGGFGNVRSNKGPTNYFTVSGITVEPSLARGNSAVEMHLPKPDSFLQVPTIPARQRWTILRGISQICSI